jgi:protein-disulfide isomerase
MGNPDAKVRLIEFGSMTCPHCRVFDEEAVPDLISKYVKTGQVSWEFRNYVRDALDVTASLLARCNGAKSFFPVTRAIYKGQAAWEAKIEQAPNDQLTAIDALPTEKKFSALAKLTGLQQLAAASGLPAASSSKCLSDEKSVKELADMDSRAMSDYPGFQGTPAFVINGTLVDLGPITEAEVWPTLESKIKAALGERG